MAIRAGHKVTVADFDALGVYALKTGDESVTSSTSLQNDDQLFLPLSANAKYIFNGYLVYTGALDPAGGLSLQFTVPSGSSGLWTNFGTNANVSPSVVNYNVVAESFGSGSPRGVGSVGSGTTMSCQPRGYISTSTTSGNLQLRWAQNVSDATSTVVKTGSWLQVVRFS